MPHEAAIRALEELANGDWDASHKVCQEDEADPFLARVHAHLHRVEGDIGNAAYWYTRAGIPAQTDSHEAEFERLARDARE